MKAPKDMMIDRDRIRGSKVAVGMSGGVDSSVSAYLLKKQGYEVIGLFMKLWHDPCGTGQNACCDERALADAQKVAKKIGIPLYVVDVRKEFKKAVADYFIKEYKNLRTPNPCVVCNKKIKFGWLLDFAEKIGCDYLATGHYARIKGPVIPAKAGIQKREMDPRVKPEDDNSLYHLLKGVDESKDQSYFLYQLDQGQLSKIIFPVGGMTKEEVRKIAEKAGLPVYQKKESQEVCFIEDDYRGFLKRNLSDTAFEPGEIIDGKGNIVGRHEGLINYTVGQRKRIQINQKSKIKNQNDSGHSVAGSDQKPLYVIKFNRRMNRLIVGRDEELFKKEFEVRDMNWISTEWNVESKKATDLTVKIRYKAEGTPCRLYSSNDNEKSEKLDSSRQASNNKIRVALDRPVRAITPGQSAVFYLGDEVVGGGIISS